MNTLVVVPCTDRKRVEPPFNLRARNLPTGPLEDVVKEWASRIDNHNERVTPDRLYCGRAYKEAQEASQKLSAELCIISAGHGVVREHEEIAPYSLTVSVSKEDSISSRVAVAEGTWSACAWWKLLCEKRPASLSLRALLANQQPDLVMLALSENYARMVYEDLAETDPKLIRNLRIFGAGISHHLPEKLADAVMPYDARFNGNDTPRPGTMTDFASRAIHHFTDCLNAGVIGGCDPVSDREGLAELMDSWAWPEVPRRARMTDEEVIAFVLEKWTETRGRSGATLRLLRDSGNACEQGRFKDLFKQAASMRHASQRVLV